ncbi:protein SICKLE [Actinidia eriantha]|uniref:protein SICKLE n=1 Tax=Actinidia eriantha TaxID=165200 RepID=UPI0025879E4F|nr:protein SICKLE [Actinidia eriantha]XP_057503708.1 protein SICKLE [Actinidia eriantha]
MEESEKRRERLKAMRTEASQAVFDNEVGAGESHHLSNPLIETSAVPPLQTNLYATPRFDYYTDPMSAFSADKRRGNVSNLHSQDCLTPPRPRHPEMTPPPAYLPRPNYSPDQRMYRGRGPHHSSGPRNPEMTPSPAQHFQANYSPDQRMYQARGPYHGSGPRNPEMIPSPAYQPQPNYSPGQRMYQAPGHYHGSGPNQSPMGMISPHGPHRGTPRGPSSYYNPSNSSGVGNFSSPGFGSSASSNSGQGRGSWIPSSGSGFGGSPSSNFGRGRGRWSGSGRGGRGGGLGSHDSVSAELRPDLYYNKSMVEDPWKFLEPVIWSGHISVKSWNTPNTLESPSPNSTGVKKARISESTSASSSQPSLAEYLAAAFNEAVNDEGSHDQPN